MHDKMICGMVRDDKGDVWISTTLGIWQYETSTGKLKGHNESGGESNSEYVLGAVVRQDDGNICFGISDGIVAFNPRKASIETPYLGKVQLTRLMANGRVLNPMDSVFSLPHDGASLTLEFSLLDYINTENTAFQYRLNHSENWMQTNAGINQLDFLQLLPGHYTLEVRAMANGEVSDKVTTLIINVRKAWYNTWWARTIYLLLFLVFT